MQVLIGNSISKAVGIPFFVLWVSCAGPVLYNMYSSRMGKLTLCYIVNLLVYADYKTVYDSFHLKSMDNKGSKRQNMENCLSGIVEWTGKNRFKLNNEKTEFMAFASERQRHKVTSMDIGKDGIKVGAADDIKHVGGWLDKIIDPEKTGGNSVQDSFEK